MSIEPKHRSIWENTPTAPLAMMLDRDLSVDVVVIGGGITGLTAALLLAENGQKVALLEAREIGSGVSGKTTAHATQIIDTRYQELESIHGRGSARAVAESSAAAISHIEARVANLHIECGFTRRPGYLFTERAEDVEMLRVEREACVRAGLGAEFAGFAPLPFPTRGAVRLGRQAQFDIGRYLTGVLQAARAQGVAVFEGARVIAVEDGEPCVAHVESGPTVRAKHVFAATHVPTVNLVALQTKIAAYRSYVMAYVGFPKLTDGLFWDTADPYHYFSSFSVRGADYLILGGQDHKTGVLDRGASPFEALQAYVNQRFGGREAEYAWSAQVEEPVDGLPYIGRNSASEHVFVATGFSGNGMTFGTLAAMIVSDLIRGETNPWTDLYRATRATPIGSVSTYLRENVDFPIHFLIDRLGAGDRESIANLPNGEGRVVKVDGRRTAVQRDEHGRLHAVSAVCSHMGCVVKFNREEKSWDCPCHGSRFDARGAVLDGPATRPLKAMKLPDLE